MKTSKSIFLALSILSTTVPSFFIAQGGVKNPVGDPAKIYLYRPKNPAGMAVVYNVFINEEQVGLAKNGFTTVYEVTEPGEIEIWGETEKKMSLKIDVEEGKEYYVKCAVKMGAMVGRPKFTLETPEKGKKTYNKLSKN